MARDTTAVVGSCQENTLLVGRCQAGGKGLSAVGARVRGMTTRIDCDTCAVRGLACGDCVVTVLLGPPPELTFDDDACRALDVLAQGGLVPPLRLVQPVASPEIESA
jgi:hypothetical protein